MRLIVSIVVLACLAVTFACSDDVVQRAIPTPESPKPTPVPREISLPADDASHDSPIEWWYYNGHLEASDGAEYSFHFVIFQTQGDGSANRIEFGQTGITDVERGVHTYLSSEGFGISETYRANPTSGILELDLGNFSLDISSDGKHSFAAKDSSGTSSIRLQTDQPREVMLHDEVGWMDWPFGWTYYYSYPRMQTKGELTLDGAAIPVSGEVWYDHQWGDFFVVGKPAGWQWFALHMENGNSLMLSEVRGADGDVIDVVGTLIDTESGHRVLDQEIDGISLETTDQWTSPKTGGVYPSEWNVQIDSIGLDVVISPAVADQEVPALPYGNPAAAYWEGRVNVLDPTTLEVIGVGFAELSGYVEPEPLGWRKRSE